MPVISIRVDAELFQKIEAKRGNNPKSEFYRKILEDSLNENVNKVNTSEYIKIQAEAAHLRASNIELMRLLNQEQALHMQTQMRLPALPPARKWWHFWK